MAKFIKYSQSRASNVPSLSIFICFWMLKQKCFNNNNNKRNKAKNKKIYICEMCSIIQLFARSISLLCRKKHGTHYNCMTFTIHAQKWCDVFFSLLFFLLHEQWRGLLVDHQQNRRYFRFLFNLLNLLNKNNNNKKNR